LALLAALLLGCGSQAETPAPATGATYFPIGLGDAELQLQLALSRAEQQRGLMFRESLPVDHGMLFLFERPGPRGFWMRNTSIPLDIGYFDARGKLLEIHKLFPHDENPVRSRSSEVLIAVETNRGWFDRNGIRPGARIDLAMLTRALQRRGVARPDLEP
jgi:uncharacterized membrane protein (UPF0127 family)